MIKCIKLLIITLGIFLTSITAFYSNAMAAQSFSSKRISVIKQGYLEINKSVSVGAAFDNYSYCKTVDWKSFETKNGRKIVEVNCAINTEEFFTKKYYEEGMTDIDYDLRLALSSLLYKHALTMKPKLKQFNIIYQFQVNYDDTFEIAYAGYQSLFFDGVESVPSNEDFPDDLTISTLREISNDESSSLFITMVYIDMMTK
ncbi:MAG: hypothetical protein L3J04_06520 [Robiginitomaculum sp.]|nr:hypothetical protein [Robiginitomaculum sp.]